MKSISYWCVLALFLFNGSLSYSAGRGLLDQIVLHPTTQPEKSTGERKVLPSGLEVWIYKRAETQPTQQKLYVLHFIGNASRAERECPEYLKLFPPTVSPEIWSVNYPGYGGSKGEAKLANLAPAALDAYDQIKQVAQTSPIWISAFSVGALSALYVASERPAQAVVLRNPLPLKELILRDYSWASWIVNDIPKELDSVKNAEKVKGPALFMTSEKDEIIHPSLQSLIVSAYSGKSQVILFPGANHNDAIPESVHSEIFKSLEKLVAQ